METLNKDYWKGLPTFDDFSHSKQERIKKAKSAEVAAKHKADRITPKQLKQILGN